MDFSKPNLHQKGRGQCLWSVACLSTTAFWILVKPLHLRSTFSKLMRSTENHNACSQHCSTERAQFFCTTPDCRLHNQCFKIWTNWATKFCHPPYSRDLLPTDYHFFKHLHNFFAGKMLPQPAGGRKCFPRVHQISKHNFYALGINKLISRWQKCVTYNGSYFDY